MVGLDRRFTENVDVFSDVILSHLERLRGRPVQSRADIEATCILATTPLMFWTHAIIEATDVLEELLVHSEKSFFDRLENYVMMMANATCISGINWEEIFCWSPADDAIPYRQISLQRDRQGATNNTARPMPIYRELHFLLHILRSVLHLFTAALHVLAHA
jgi:hypothetical protein